MGKNDYVVSVMCATGSPQRQYVMSQPMPRSEAEAMLNVIVKTMQVNKCFCVNGTWINPAAVITMRVVRDNGRKLNGCWNDDLDDWGNDY